MPKGESLAEYLYFVKTRLVYRKCQRLNTSSLSISHFMISALPEKKKKITCSSQGRKFWQ